MGFAQACRPPWPQPERQQLETGLLGRCPLSWPGPSVSRCQFSSSGRDLGGSVARAGLEKVGGGARLSPSGCGLGSSAQL